LSALTGLRIETSLFLVSGKAPSILPVIGNVIITNPSKKPDLFGRRVDKSEHDILVDVSAESFLMIAFDVGPSVTTTFQRNLMG
jgi:hypothetical protein